MGQPIPEHLRQRISRQRHVREVTPQHVILTNGRVLDPSEHLVEDRPARMVLKLIACNCFWTKHQVGRHTIIHGRVQVFADGRELPLLSYPDFCRGHWAIEEVIKK